MDCDFTMRIFLHMMVYDRIEIDDFINHIYFKKYKLNKVNSNVINIIYNNDKSWCISTIFDFHVPLQYKRAYITYYSHNFAMISHYYTFHMFRYINKDYIINKLIDIGNELYRIHTIHRHDLHDRIKYLIDNHDCIKINNLYLPSIFIRFII